MPDITQKLLTKGAAHGRTGEPLSAVGVVIHYVGNPGSSAIANRNYFENGSGGNYVSAHYVVGLNGEIIQCVPENERAQHAGKSYAPQYKETAKLNNARYLGIENCHPDSGGKFSDITRKSLVALSADICFRYNFELSAVFRHYDVTGKSCPMYYVNNSGEWTKLKNDIASGVIALMGKTKIVAKLGQSQASVAKSLEEWAKGKNATALFVSLAEKYVKYAPTCGGVNPVVAYCQAAKETAFGRFGGVLNESFKNPCGMKTAAGGGDFDKNAHQKFDSWDDGIKAQLDHLALYAGAEGYPRKDTTDPRHFPEIKGTAATVEALGGKWAGSLYYGQDVVKLSEGIRLAEVITVEDKLLELVKGSSINSPQYWINALKDFKYFDGFVGAMYEKYCGK